MTDIAIKLIQYAAKTKDKLTCGELRRISGGAIGPSRNGQNRGYRQVISTYYLLPVDFKT